MSKLKFSKLAERPSLSREDLEGMMKSYQGEVQKVTGITPRTGQDLWESSSRRKMKDQKRGKK